MSWNPTPKEGGLLAKVVPKHETFHLSRSTSYYLYESYIVQELEDI